VRGAAPVAALSRALKSFFVFFHFFYVCYQVFENICFGNPAQVIPLIVFPINSMMFALFSKLREMEIIYWKQPDVSSCISKCFQGGHYDTLKKDSVTKKLSRA
jgi:hypothetical protein